MKDEKKGGRERGERERERNSIEQLWLDLFCMFSLFNIDAAPSAPLPLFDSRVADCSFPFNET